MIFRPEHEDPDPRRTPEVVWVSTASMRPGQMVETHPLIADAEVGYTTSSPGEEGSW